MEQQFLDFFIHSDRTVINRVGGGAIDDVGHVPFTHGEGSVEPLDAITETKRASVTLIRTKPDLLTIRWPHPF